MTPLVERLRAELAAAEAELREHRASWAYAFAMGATNHGGTDHPVHVRTRARTAELVARCRAIQARIAEHEL